MRPFEQLGEQEQKAATDVAVALTVLGTRIPTLSKVFTDAIVTEFTNCYKLTPNVGKYALRELGQNLFSQNWAFSVHKAGVMLTTEFKPVEAVATNGEMQT
jgi:hypothetical protein